MTSPRYSEVYEKLVDGEDDILGHIAYSVYKSQKVAYIKRHMEESGPSNEDDLKAQIDHFHKLCAIPEQISFYKERAVSLSQDFLEESLGAYIEEVDAQYEQKYKNFYETNKPKPMYQGVIEGLIGSSLTAFILWGIYILDLLPIK